MWTLEDALTLIRDLQPQLHLLKYHVALGGGVLNKGQSEKDLDLYIFPFDYSDIAPVLPFLERMWGEAEPINKFADRYPDDISFEAKYKFLQREDGRRIDVFITKNGVFPTTEEFNLRTMMRVKNGEATR